MPDSNSSPSFSYFWPLLILVSAIVIWSGYQDYAVNSQRSLFHSEFANAEPAIKQAQGVQTRYINLMKDLVQTSAKDQAAANIVKAAESAHLLHITNSTNTAAATPPAQ